MLHRSTEDSQASLLSGESSTGSFNQLQTHFKKVYRLTYFNSRARAETSRLIFAVAGQLYEDIRVPYADWPKLKPTFPFGKLPVLDIIEDEKTIRITQSHAIALYLAKEFGYAGNNPEETAQCHEIHDTITDMNEVLYEINPIADQIVRQTKIEEYRVGKLTYYLDHFEQYLKEHASQTGFVVGYRLSYADLALMDALEQIMSIPGLEGAHEMVAAHHDLYAHYLRIREIPIIKHWISARPVTRY